MTTTPREQILTEAAGLISGDRNTTYGPPTKNFANTAALWNVQIGHKLTIPLTAADVAQLMAQLKMARMIAQPKRDNYVDAAGYLACGWECEEAAEREPEAPTSRYFRDPDGWYWRWDEGSSEMTHVKHVGASRALAFGTTPEDFLREVLPEEIPVDQVPQWAR